MEIHVARYHNILEPEGSRDGGREKVPAAICRKVVKARSAVSILGQHNESASALAITFL
jgi:hypothetical protein